MSYSSVALTAYRRGSVVEALWAYEQAMSQETLDAGQKLDMVVLYIECQDPGVAAHNALSSEFLEAAWARSMSFST